MKRNWFLAGATLLCFILLLMGSAAAEGAFSFRNGVAWDTGVDGMMAAEGLREGDGSYNQHDDNGYTYFYLKAADVYYVFRDGRLVNAYARLSDGKYADEAQRQAALNGAPADVSADTISTLLNTLVPGRAAPVDFSELTVWRLPDGTLTALFTVDGVHYIAYFHEQRILNGV
jgi:hypothetical protein